VPPGNIAFDEHVAAHYEAWYETLDGRRADELEKGVLDWLLKQGWGGLSSLPPGQAKKPALPGSVLEIGCGTGHFSRWLGGQGLTAVGLDYSPAMLAQARALDGVPLVRSDARWLPFADDAFDLTALVTTLEFLEQPREVLAEALRVARGGVILGVLNRWSLMGLQRRLTGLFRPTVYDAAHFYGVGELKRLLRSAAGRQARIVWRTTLFPRGWPWSQMRLPWGGFIGMALMVEDKE